MHEHVCHCKVLNGILSLTLHLNNNGQTMHILYRAKNIFTRMATSGVKYCDVQKNIFMDVTTLRNHILGHISIFADTIVTKSTQSSFDRDL